MLEKRKMKKLYHRQFWVGHSRIWKELCMILVNQKRNTHFDVMDGDFVPNLTFGPKFISELRSKSEKIFDVHLMIYRVNKYLDDYIKAGSNIITFHYEINSLNEIIDKIKLNGIKAGIAIKPKTSWEEIKNIYI